MAKRKRKNRHIVIKINVTSILILICLIALLFTYFNVPSFKQKADEAIPGLEDFTDNFKGLFVKKDPLVVSGDLSIHFLELGNEYTGDCIYIKAGETDVLIDAGSRKSSSTTIKKYLDNYVDDNKLEYVIATHAHQDHIAGFVGSEANPGILDLYACDVIIDFPKTDSTTTLLSDYRKKVASEISEGAQHYTALECYNNENGAKRTYNLSDSVELEILYNYYYKASSSDENNYSVCLMINHYGASKEDAKHFLFTGDLEKEGEEYLVEYNKLPVCEVYKAGHHGSKTSSNNCLLNVIKPKIVCVCCCAGSNEYTTVNDNTFPTQAFITRIKPFTELIYVTSLYDFDNKTHTSMNGNIVISSTPTGVVVKCSNNDVILKETEWFKKNRKWA